METVGIVFRIFGGLALFMFGISLLSNTLKRFAGARLKRMLGHATSNPLRGMAAGAMATFLVQSSSVTVLLLLGLVNSGVMQLRQAVYVILGSEIGTTITAQIVACKMTLLFFPLLIVGFVLRAVGADKERMRDTGELIFCLGLIFLAMQIMTDGARPLNTYPGFPDLVIRFGHYPIFGILLGTVFTAITSSSSATTSVVIALSMEGVIDLVFGISLIIGANIGTCVLELVAIIGTTVSAKRTGLAQFMINLLGAILIYPVIFPFADLIAMTAENLPRQIANAHTIFNLTVSFLLLPFTGLFIVLLEKIVPGSEPRGTAVSATLDTRILSIPTIALSNAEREVHGMVSITEEMLKLARRGVIENDQDARQTVREYEKTVDLMNGRLAEYLGQISTLQLTNSDRLLKRALAHTLTDTERIADIAENLVDYVEQRQSVFSRSAIQELDNLFANALYAHDTAVRAMKRKGRTLDIDLGDVQHQGRVLMAEYWQNYYMRQVQKDEILAIDVLYPMMLRDLERIGGHSVNIAHHFDSL